MITLITLFSIFYTILAIRWYKYGDDRSINERVVYTLATLFLIGIGLIVFIPLAIHYLP